MILWSATRSGTLVSQACGFGGFDRRGGDGHGLADAFGTARAVSGASQSDLEKVPGINEATARLIYDYFHEKG